MFLIVINGFQRFLKLFRVFCVDTYLQRGCAPPQSLLPGQPAPSLSSNGGVRGQRVGAYACAAQPRAFARAPARAVPPHLLTCVPLQFAWLLWAIDFMLWLLLPLPLLGPLKMILAMLKGTYSKEEKTGQRLSVLCADAPISKIQGYEEVTTVHEMMQFSFAKYAKCVARAHPSPRARMRGEPTCANRPEPPFLPNPTSVRAR